MTSDFLKNILSIAKEFFTKATADLDKYTERKGEIQVKSDRVILLTPSHIQFAKFGRGPGKKPPLDPILEWVSKKGIIFEGTDKRGTAFAIQAKISRVGTSNWVPNAPNALNEALNKHFEKYSKEAGNVIASKTSDEVNKIYKEVLPESKFKH